MRKYITALLLVGPILLISIICCTPSLHPLYTDDDLVFKPELVGVWKEMNDSEEIAAIWEFIEQSSSDTDQETGAELLRQYYRLRYIAEDRIGRFSAHLVNLEGALFLDLYPTDLDSYEMTDLYMGHMVPAHTFLYVKQIEPQIVMGYYDGEWLQQYVADNPQAIGHDYVGTEEQGLLLTAPTENLQAFMLECLGQEGSLTEDSLFDLVPAKESELAGITVRVTLDGEPVLGPVYICDSGKVIYREVRSDESGIGVVTKLIPGTYDVRTSKTTGEWHYSASQDVTLKPGDALQIELELVKLEGP